jgi:hypothetical protein
MTRDEAIAIRSRQLSGGAVNPQEAREAEEVLRQAIPPKRTVEWIKKRPREMLAKLALGPMDRDDFYERAKALYEEPSGAYMAISRLQECGLISCEVRLTDAGAQMLNQKRRSR